MTRLSNACRSRQFPPATNQQWLIKAFSISYCSFADLSTSIIVTFIESWWLIATNFLHSQQRIKFEDILILDEYLAEEFLKKIISITIKQLIASFYETKTHRRNLIYVRVLFWQTCRHTWSIFIYIIFWWIFEKYFLLFLNSGYNFNYKCETDVFYFKELRNTNQKIYILHNLITGLKALI